MKIKIMKAVEIMVITIIIIIGSLLELSRAYIMEHNQNEKVKYDAVDFNNDGVSEFLIISGNGIVKKIPHDIYENTEIIFICQGISFVEPDAIYESNMLKVLIMPYEAYSDDLYLPRQTDLLFIEDNEYLEFVGMFI